MTIFRGCATPLTDKRAGHGEGNDNFLLDGAEVKVVLQQKQGAGDLIGRGGTNRIKYSGEFAPAVQIAV